MFVLNRQISRISLIGGMAMDSEEGTGLAGTLFGSGNAALSTESKASILNPKGPWAHVHATIDHPTPFAAVALEPSRLHIIHEDDETAYE
jgi:hypothetical protein